MAENIDQDHYQRRAMRPTPKTWLKHLFWFLLTFITAALTGSIGLFNLDIVVPPIPDPVSWAEVFYLIFSIPQIYAGALNTLFQLILANPELQRNGLIYAGSLLFILLAHEAGHYIACRIYGVDATLPYFLPAPPLIAVGSFGAFIKILSPIPSKKAVFDIGVAGPIAGFIALIPIAIIGIATMETASAEVIQNAGLTTADPLLSKLIGLAFGKDPYYGYSNPFYMAAWVGLLVTSLNLIPSGQLDGGHAIYAVFGEKAHYYTGRIAFYLMIIFTALGWYYYNSPSGLLFTVLLAVMMKIKHPAPYDLTPLDGKRKWIAALTLLIFILSFMPFPIHIK